MGYSTSFSGEFEITPTLKPEHRLYLEAFSGTRRMGRKEEMVAGLPDPIREAAGLPLGPEGAFYVGGREADETLRPSPHGRGPGYNTPPEGQPSLWCQWRPNEDGTALEWDQGEKFCASTEWLIYLIETFFKRWGYVLNGEVIWRGDDEDDRGTIYVKDNQVEAVEDTITNVGPSWGRKEDKPREIMVKDEHGLMPLSVAIAHHGLPYEAIRDALEPVLKEYGFRISEEKVVVLRPSATT